MLVALGLLLISLILQLYRDRDFWFPDAEQSGGQQLAAPVAVPHSLPVSSAHRSTRSKKRRSYASSPPNIPTNDDPPAPPITIARTVLPPLEIEVVAGDAHQTVHPGTGAVHVDLERAMSEREPVSVSREQVDRGSVTTNAAERARIATSPAAAIVTHSVQPQYPLLARLMKVQGSVMLHAIIGRDCLIEDLRVLSGPPILANAAREAVRQWHFKPHLEGTRAVETRTNITVNFTISTN